MPARPEWLHANATARSLGVVRIAIALIWLFKVLNADFRSLAELPRSLYTPMAGLRILPEGISDFLLRSESLLVLQVLLVGLLVAMLVGVRPYWCVGAPLAVLLTLGEWLSKGFGGYLNHSQIPLLLLTYALVVMPCADGLSIRPLKRPHPAARYDAAMLLLALLLVTTYSLTAIDRVATAGWRIHFDGSLMSWLATRTFTPADFSSDLGLMAFRHPELQGLFQAGFFLTTIAELVSPLALRFRAVRLPWLAVIVGCHVLAAFSMRIVFWENTWLILVLVTGFPHWIARQLARATASTIESVPTNASSALASTTPVPDTAVQPRDSRSGAA